MKMEWIPRLCALAVILLSVVPAAVAVEVTFADANLEAAVRDELGIPAPTPITEADMAGLRQLDASQRLISSVTGLESASGLAALYLDECNLDDTLVANMASTLNAIPEFRLLSLADNYVVDAHSLSSFTNLGMLDISRNPIEDFTGLQSLSQLDGLHMTGTGFSDFSMLSGLDNLYDLLLYDNDLTNLTGISVMSKLRYLDVGDNDLSGSLDLSDLNEIEMLMVYGNQLTSIEGLGGMSNLLNLYAANNNMSDIQFLVDLGPTSITYIDLRGNPLGQNVYDVQIPSILANNPVMTIRYDPIPEPSTLLLLSTLSAAIVRKRK